MKGVDEVISTMLLIIIAIIIISFSFYFYHTTIYKSGEEITGEKIYCSQSSNFIILKIEGKNLTIKNDGGTKLNLDYFRVYVNGTFVNFTYSSGPYLNIGDTTTLTLNITPGSKARVRVIGDCDTGDEVIK